MGYIQPSLTQLQTVCNDQNDGASFQIEGIIDMGSKYGYGSPLLGHYVFRSGNASFPERPGLPECQFYMRRGTCRFGETCKFHHPRQRIVPACILSPRGLPLRPVSCIDFGPDISVPVALPQIHLMHMLLQ